jgi:hypothetical protein
MKRVIYCFIAVACCTLWQSAHGAIQIAIDPVPGDNVVFADTPGRVGNGGPFLGTLNGSSQWYTFCVEADGGEENLSFGTPYKVVGTSDFTATATGNTVTNAAKFLYYAYGHDLLTTLLGTYTNTGVDNGSVQDAIWSLTVKTSAGLGPNDYTNAYSNATNYWLNIGTLSADASALRAAAILAVTTDANAATFLADAARIQVLNPADTFPPAPGEQRQSVLYEVPEAATIAIWSGLGVIGLVVARRRRG